MLNSSETNNLVTLIVASTAPFVAKYGVDAPSWAALLTAIIPVAWGLYSHWDMKKIPEGEVK